MLFYKKMGSKARFILKDKLIGSFIWVGYKFKQAQVNKLVSNVSRELKRIAQLWSTFTGLKFDTVIFSLIYSNIEARSRQLYFE